MLLHPILEKSIQVAAMNELFDFILKLYAFLHVMATVSVVKTLLGLRFPGLVCSFLISGYYSLTYIKICACKAFSEYIDQIFMAGCPVGSEDFDGAGFEGEFSGIAVGTGFSAFSCGFPLIETPGPEAVPLSLVRTVDHARHTPLWHAYFSPGANISGKSIASLFSKENKKGHC